MNPAARQLPDLADALEAPGGMLTVRNTNLVIREADAQLVPRAPGAGRIALRLYLPTVGSIFRWTARTSPAAAGARQGLSGELVFNFIKRPTSSE